jgi:hypothetical protein
MTEKGYTGRRTLARALAEEHGGEIDSWRTQVYRILDGDTASPQPDTSAAFAKVLGQPEDFLIVPPHIYSESLIGQFAEDLLAAEDPAALLPEVERLIAAWREGLSALEAAALRIREVGRQGKP